MAASSESGSHSVDYDANKNPVNSVTVFQTDRAEVKRVIKVQLKDGQNDVEVKNLPTCLEEDSLRVDGIGNATIFDVVYHPPPPYDSDKYFEAVKDLNARKEKISADIAILSRQAGVLSDYSKTLTGKDTDSSSLETFLDVYSARQTKINEATTKLNDEIAQIQKEITERSKVLDADEESIRKRGARVTIVVLSEGDGEAELSLTYVVSNAEWTPLYDLRASIATDTKSKSQVALHYRASITQRTGEDWANVALTLSTASPLQGTNIPTLDPYWIGERVKFGFSSLSKSRAQMALPAMAQIPPAPTVIQQPQAEYRDSSMRESESYRAPLKRRKASVGGGAPGAPPPGFFRARDSAATEGAVSTTFSIPGLSSIPSDSDTDQQTHKVSIAELDFESVDLEWITVPKDIPSAFLRCKVKNTTKYVLLPGQANVFLNGSFVAKSSIPHVSPQESFSCSLGVDPAVRVTYHPQTKRTKTTGGSVLTTKMITTTVEQAVTIKNTRLSSLPKLIVKDHVPVSRDSRIKVTLLAPKNLTSGTNKGKAVAQAQGVTARWAQRNDEESIFLSKAAADEPDAESAQGLLEWVCDIQPGASVDLDLAWEVSAAAGIEWTKQ